MTALGDWWAQGERIALELRGKRHEVFVRRAGGGPTATLLHGFPSSSHDWAKIEPALAERHGLLYLDLLGFGATDKPLEHDYSLLEQADLVEELWRHEGIASTRIIAHDYSVSVTQELLARRAEGKHGVEITAVDLLNGGLYPDLHRPEPAQLALLDPEQGPQLSAAMNEQLLTEVLRPTFGAGYDFAADAADIWQATDRAKGRLVLHRLIRYMVDRRENERRWVDALEQTDVPLAFLWGMLDPISGAHIGERIRERLPDAPFTALEDVGHWPPLEAPGRVAQALLGR